MEDAELHYDPENDPTSEVQLAFEQAFMDSVPGIVGVGMTTGATGDDALLVYLESAEAKGLLPESFQGLAVVVEVVGEIRAQDQLD